MLDQKQVSCLDSSPSSCFYFVREHRGWFLPFCFHRGEGVHFAAGSRTGRTVKFTRRCDAVRFVNARNAAAGYESLF